MASDMLPHVPAQRIHLLSLLSIAAFPACAGPSGAISDGPDGPIAFDAAGNAFIRATNGLYSCGPDDVCSLVASDPGTGGKLLASGSQVAFTNCISQPEGRAAYTVSLYDHTTGKTSEIVRKTDHLVGEGGDLTLFGGNILAVEGADPEQLVLHAWDDPSVAHPSTTYPVGADGRPAGTKLASRDVELFIGHDGIIEATDPNGGPTRQLASGFSSLTQMLVVGDDLVVSDGELDGGSLISIRISDGNPTVLARPVRAASLASMDGFIYWANSDANGGGGIYRISQAGGPAEMVNAVPDGAHHVGLSGKRVLFTDKAGPHSFGR